jgi:maltose O-acetyltransferase
MGCQFSNRQDFEIGRSVINQRCHIDNRGGITIGNHVSIGPQVAIITADHDMNTSNIEGRSSPVIIEDYVFIGARALILPGVILKKGSVIAAGAVVVGDVEEFSIVAGVPAKTIGRRRRDLDYTTDYQAWLN